MKYNDIKNTWNNYFFREAPIEGIAIFRILLGIVILSTFLQDALNMHDFWGPLGLNTIETAKKNLPNYHLGLFSYLKPSFNILYLIVTIHISAILCFLFGYKTRIASVILFITMVSLHQRNINILSSADLLMRILMMLMVFAPSGNAYSIDSLIAKLKGKTLKKSHTPWVHRLIQIQIAVVYVSTVISKMKGETWLDGSALYYATRLEDFTRYPVPFLFDWVWSLKLFTWSTLIFEFALGTLIFIDELRKPLIVLGIIFHLGIEYSMSIPTFEWIMIAGLMAMFRIEDYKIFDKKLKVWLTKKVNLIEKETKLKAAIIKVIS